MGVEIEIKIRIQGGFDAAAAMRGWQVSEHRPRHFEDNRLLDFPEATLRMRRCLLRVRTAGDDAILTFKGPPVESSDFKVREEIEVSFESAAVLIQVLERLGLQLWFRYQKYRTEYKAEQPESPGRLVHLALDETPIGTFLEIEGSEDSIRGAARSMGVGQELFLTDSYYALYLQYCRARGLPPGHMVFGEDFRSHRR
ncbi:MAG: class IV adenylate cyclase [Acidobacteriota bacterium]